MVQRRFSVEYSFSCNAISIIMYYSKAYTTVMFNRTGRSWSRKENHNSFLSTPYDSYNLIE